MRNLFLLFIGLSLILFTSCKDDDNDAITLESQLTDAWIITDLTFNGSLILEVSGEELIFDIETEIGESTSRMVLASDGTYEATGETYFSLDLLQDGELVSSVPAEDNEPVDFSGSGTWSVNENDEVIIDDEIILFENDQLIFATGDLGMIPFMEGFTFDFETLGFIFSRE